MNRNRWAAVVGLLVVLAAVWFVFLRDRGKSNAAVPVGGNTRSGQIVVTAGSGAPSTHEQTDSANAPKGMAPRWTIDLDPEGPLTLEGQVLGPDGKGVAGAQIWISSNPPRTTTSEGDGSFTITKLVGRHYDLGATSGKLVGGPVSTKLTEKSDPVVIHLVSGAQLVVTVSDDDKHPIAGAEVRESEHVSATTDETGKAIVKPLASGWKGVSVTKEGYAANGGFTVVAVGGAPTELAITLHKGYPVSGRVVDEAGKPVAKAKVGVVGMFGIQANEKGVDTDDKGQFAIAALAPGRHILTATDGEHSPAQSPPVTVADKAVTNVEITMKAGGSILGTVVDVAKKPVPFATVRAQASGTGGQRGFTSSFRQVTADKSGAFEIRGLPRANIQIRAESDTSASKVTSVNLDKDLAKKGLELVLDVGGVISGVVVDDKGAPVTEVQVHAFLDMWGSGGNEDVALAGMSSATTDGAGAFAIRGIPDGQYKLWASRGTNSQRDWGQTGVTAKAGDRDVKITLASPGTLKGIVKIDGASAPPKAAFVEVGYQASQPTGVDGAFSVADLSPGQYEVTFRGPEFAELVKHDVKIEAGKTTDLSTVTVMRGRKLTGKVVDSGGSPVAGAKVKVAFMLFSVDGAEEQLANIEQQQGVRSAITDTDGAFTIIGLSQKATSAAAEQADQGRSMAVSIPEGKDDPDPITLTLHGYGSIAGKVVLKGKPQAGVTVSVATKGGGAQATFAQTTDDGTFNIAKVPEGPTVLSAMRQAGQSFKATSATVTVVAKQTAQITIDIPVGTITLIAQPKAAAGATVDSAQVFLFNGAVAAMNAKQLMDSFLGGQVQSMKFWLGAGKPWPEFDELVPGSYSLCMVPITGNLQDPSFGQKLQQHMDVLKVFCKQMTVAASPNQQTFAMELPSMVPLPAN